jgi:hypothetical protein
MANEQTVDERTAQLLAALDLLSRSGLDIDRELVAAEMGHAEKPTSDERALQKLGAASRETWNAHRATRKALQALRQST